MGSCRVKDFVSVSKGHDNICFHFCFSKKHSPIIFEILSSTSFCTKNSHESIDFTLKKLGVLQSYKFKTHPANETPILIQHISCGSLDHWEVLTAQDSHYSTPYCSVSEPDLVSVRLLSREEKENKRV